MSEVHNLHDEVAEPVESIGDARVSNRAARGKSRLRQRLMLAVVPPLAAIAALVAYLHTGRYVETDNAYVKSTRVMIKPEVTGTITKMAVIENQRIAAHDVLFSIDDEPLRIDLERAEAAVAQARTTIAARKQAYKRVLAEIELHQSNVAFTAAQHRRQQELQKVNLGTVEDLDSAHHELEQAQEQVHVAQRESERLLAELGGDSEMPAELHPEYQLAAAERNAARLDLEHATVRAPINGIATKVPNVGDYVESGKAVMAIVADAGKWVEANFKETDLTHVRPGQAVNITVDAYPDHQWHGRVQSISEATGAEFALLPPQNATGNWIKVVQRIPVRIALDPAADAPPLRMGMSCIVRVDTGREHTLAGLLHLR